MLTSTTLSMASRPSTPHQPWAATSGACPTSRSLCSLPTTSPPWKIPAWILRLRTGPGMTSSNGVSQLPATLTASAPMKMALTPTRSISGVSPYWQALRYPGISALDRRPTIRRRDRHQRYYQQRRRPRFTPVSARPLCRRRRYRKTARKGSRFRKSRLSGGWKLGPARL